MSDEQRRSAYRIQYPTGEGPMLKVNRGVFPVTDLSEGGLSFSTEIGTFLTGETMNSKLRFKDGYCFNAIIEIVRLSSKSVGAKLSNPLPYKKITEEQLRLKKSYSVKK